MTYTNASLKFVITSDLQHSTLRQFAAALSPWLDVSVVPGPGNSRFFFIEGTPGDGETAFLAASPVSLVPSYVTVHFAGGAFSARELRIVELTFCSTTGAQPVVILNRAFTGLGLVAFVAGIDTVSDAGHALGFELPAAATSVCEARDGVLCLRCWCCRRVLPPEEFAPRPFLLCIRLAAVDGVWTACAACAGPDDTLGVLPESDALCLPMRVESP